MSGRIPSGDLPTGAELVRPDPRLGVPVPAYGGRSVANIGPTVFDATGRRRADGTPLAPRLEPDLDPFHGRRAEGPVIVVMIDGLGWDQYARWPGRRSVGPAWTSGARPITTVFPSTTSAALASLSTGTPPGRHGLVGYRQYLPKFGTVADMLKMSPLGSPSYDLLVGPTWTPADVSGAPSLFERYGVGAAVSRDRFRGSGFTRILYQGAEYVGYATASELAHHVVELLQRESPPPVIFVYWDELDTVQHLQGINDRLYALEVERIAHLLDYVARSAPPARRADTQVLVTGDHGQVPLSAARTLRVESTPVLLAEMSRPLAGDRRAGLFRGRTGRVPELRGALEQVLPPGSRVLAVADAVDAGLFGPPPFHPELEERAGDLLVLVPSPCGLTYLAPGAPIPTRQLLAGHGGLEPAELLVPLVSGRLSEFDAPSGERRTA